MDDTDEAVSGECICMLGLILVSLMINSQIRSPEKLQDVAKFPKSWSKEWAEWWVASAWSLKTRARKCLSAVLMPVTHLEVIKMSRAN